MRTTHSVARQASWQPYLAAFGEVTLVARVTARPAADGPLVQSPGMRIHPVPDYAGLRQFLVRGPSIAWSVRRLGRPCDVFVGRVGEPLSLLLYLRSRVVGARFVSMVGADPEELFRVVVPGAAGRVVALVLGEVTRHVVRRSDAVVYVTERWLQSRYPARPGASTLARSDVVVVPRDPDDESRSSGDGPARLISIGTMQTLNKGQDSLVRVVRELTDRGVDVELGLVGDGRRAPVVRRLAAGLGVGHRVHLHGQVNDGAAVQDLLDEADVYVSASRSEGLPRATIEAMSRGLPAVTTDVGGAAELVDRRWLVAPDDVGAMADRIETLIGDPALRRTEGAVNRRRAIEIARRSEGARFVEFLAPLAAAGGRAHRRQPRS